MFAGGLARSAVAPLADPGGVNAQQNLFFADVVVAELARSAVACARSGSGQMCVTHLGQLVSSHWAVASLADPGGVNAQQNLFFAILLK